MKISRIRSRIAESLTEACRYSPLTKVISEEEVNRILEQESGWIPCSKRLPAPETEVLITARRKYTNGEYREIITAALYEDGKMLESDSCWVWIDIEGEYDEENDCYIIPEGWWECRHFNADDVYNNLIDCEVIAWMPLPESYRVSAENAQPEETPLTEQPQTNADRIRSMTDEELALTVMCPADITGGDTKCDRYGNCRKCTLDWLQRESEE